MVDTSEERYVVTPEMGQAIKPQYHTHSQGSCPPLHFYCNLEGSWQRAMEWDIHRNVRRLC
jgi:hypothetical protein